MIQEMSLDLFGERFAVFTATASAEDVKLARALAVDGADHAAGAVSQQKYAEMARDLIRENANDESRGEMVRIAVWHYERCAAGFRRAVESFESAAKIQKTEKARRRLLEKAEAMAEEAMRAEFAVLELQRTEKTKKGGSNHETG